MDMFVLKRLIADFDDPGIIVIGLLFAESNKVSNLVFSGFARLRLPYTFRGVSRAHNVVRPV